MVDFSDQNEEEMKKDSIIYLFLAYLPDKPS